MVTQYAKMGAKAVQKAVTEVGKQQKFGSLEGNESPFKQMLDSMNSGHEFANKLGIEGKNMGLPSSIVNAISADGIPVNSTDLTVGLDQPNGINKVVDLLSEVNDGQMQMENMVNQILYSDKRFSSQELLAIQAHVMHFAQVTELVVKTADQGVSSIKALLNTNIQ